MVNEKVLATPFTEGDPKQRRDTLMKKLKRTLGIKPPTSRELIKEMERSLPIRMYPLNASVQYLREQGLDLPADKALPVTKVMDSGDVGGVMCQIEYDEKQHILISITHLKVPIEHPLSMKILAYQRHRIKKLAKQARHEEEW